MKKIIIYIDGSEVREFSDPKKAQNTYEKLKHQHKLVVKIFKNGIWKDVPGKHIVEELEK
jgi:hypothetical protein